MSDRAANCVLGDKDGSKRREEETPSWLSLCSETVVWSLGGGGRKKELVKKEIKV